LGRELTAAGHTVAVIDRKPEAFSRLGESFIHLTNLFLLFLLLVADKHIYELYKTMFD
jgi:hypothetical protein